MDLPKGIVVNSPGLSQDVERINAAPVSSEIIAHFWKVYTTTQRTLHDPTAERLENYWWRIWGSRQRELRGATVAQLFLYISDGSTFNGRPLSSNANRFEGHAKPRRIPNGKKVNGGTSADSFNAANTRPSSSSKGHKKAISVAPMPHPILKKSRGPSNTGPRPTARFVSPQRSEDEGESPMTNEHVIIRPPTPPVEGESNCQNMLKVPQPATSSKKKGKAVVVATVAGRRRPAVLRRKSSQSIVDEQESRQRPEKKSASREDPNGQIRKSVKTGIAGAIRQQQKSSGAKLTNEEVGLGVAGPGPSTQLRARKYVRLEPAVPHNEDVNEEELEELQIQNLLLAQANARVERSKKARSSTGATPGRKSRSISLSSMKSSGDGVTSSTPDLKGRVSIACGYAEATGEISATLVDTKSKDKGKGCEDKDKLQFPKGAMPGLVVKDFPVNRLEEATVSQSHSQLSFLLEQNVSRTIAQNSKGKGKEENADSESDTQVLRTPKRGKKWW